MKHRGKYHRKHGFPTISKARQWRQSRLGAIADGRLFPEQEVKQRQAQHIVTIQAYSNAWMSANRTKALKYTTLKRYQGILNTQFLPTFGTLPLVDVNRAKVRALVADMSRAGLKLKSIKNVLSALSALYSDAIEDGHISAQTGQSATEADSLSQTRRTGLGVYL